MSQKKDNLGIRLLRAELAADVRDIVAADSALSNPGNWHPVDNRDTNSNVITNQATNGGKAATELITNMVDAMLTKLCMEKGIDPKGPKAPKNMYEAVDRFVDQLNGGRIIKATREWKRKYARENLTIGITAKVRKQKEPPCYTFADNGEGQYPQDFPKTFLSLSAKNKSQIPFVQGKYNMGSSGVLSFCDDWLKLIVSRRYDEEQDWGWTLIRKNKLAQGGMPYAEYFAPGKKIQTIGDGAIKPFCLQDGKEFDGVALRTGTIVKLYNFRVGKGYNDFRQTREAFNENLVETILPFRIYDFRWPKAPGKGKLRALGIDDRAFYGMEHQLVETWEEADDSDDAAEAAEGELVHIDTVNPHGLGKITVTAVLLGETIPGWYQARNSTSRIFHHVNGQVQFKQPRALLTQCKLPALKDRVAIFVDASDLDDGAHAEIWKGDREHIRETSEGQQYKEAVKDAIQRSPKLKELNHRITREALDSASTDSSRELLQELIEYDKNLMSLLSKEVPDVPAPQRRKKPKSARDDLRHSPTYVKIQKQGKGGFVDINVPINRPGPVPCVTDAVDDYFIRPDNRGDVHFKDDDTADKFDVYRTLNNGNLVLFLKPNRDKLNVGDVVNVEFGLYDEAMPQAVYADKTLRITLQAAAKKKPPKEKPDKPPQQAVGLPPFKLVTSDGREINGEATEEWDAAESGPGKFDKEAGGYIQKLDDGESLYLINYDNSFFQSYLRAQKTDARQSEVSQKYILGMRILMLGLERAIEETEKDAETDSDKLRWVATKGVASVVLSICDQLPQRFHAIGLDGEAED